MSRHHSRIRRLESRYRSHTRADDDANTRIPDDPIAVARLLGFEPDPWQCDLLTSTDERVILNCSRQTGKSTSVAILALHHALTTRDSVVLIISPSLRQSELLFEKISTFYRKLGRPGGTDAHSATALKLRNGSCILALPGSESTIRGFSPSMVLVDEAARISEELVLLRRQPHARRFSREVDPPQHTKRQTGHILARVGSRAGLEKDQNHR